MGLRLRITEMLMLMLREGTRMLVNGAVKNLQTEISYCLWNY